MGGGEGVIRTFGVFALTPGPPSRQERGASLPCTAARSIVRCAFNAAGGLCPPDPPRHPEISDQNAAHSIQHPKAYPLARDNTTRKPM